MTENPTEDHFALLVKETFCEESCNFGIEEVRKFVDG